MAMTKRDFVAIAEIIKAETETTRPQLGTLEIAKGIARHAKDVNPRFDRAKFLTACGFDSDSVGW